MVIHRPVGWVVLCVSAVSILASLGCGDATTWADPAVSIAPTQNPLVAQYNIVAPHNGSTAWVEFGEDTNYGRQTSATAATTGLAQPLTLLVAGMKAKTTYHMRAHVAWPDGNGSWVGPDQTFTTGAIPSNLQAPNFTVTRPSPNLSPQAGVELISGVPFNSNQIEALVVDLQGNIIWYFYGGAIPIKPMQNGHFIINAGGDLQEIDLSGKAIREVTVPQVNESLQTNGYSFSITDFHHDQLTLPNGHWIALANTLKEFTNLPGYPGVLNVVGDALLDIDLTGNVVWAWSGFDHLDINRHPWGFLPALPPNNGAGDWTHGNALDYTQDGNLLFSMRAQDWVIKIDYQNGTGSGDVLWHLGDGGDFTLAEGDPSLWFYGQHDSRVLSTDGSQTKLTIWDNGNLRTNDPQCGTITGCYSRATIFQLDEGTKVANVFWQDAPGLFSSWGGSVGVLANGNVEFDANAAFANSASQVSEVTQTDSPQVVWQLEINGAAYRAYRIPSLYPGVTWQK